MRRIKTITLCLIVLSLGACNWFQNSSSTTLSASGTISATDVQISPEISGKVTEIDAAEGDSVKVGDILFKEDTQLLEAQLAQAQASEDSANSGLDAANAQLKSAQDEYTITLQTLQQQDTTNRTNTWNSTADSSFTLPSWYFQQDEQITAAQAEVTAAQQALDTEKTNLNAELKKASNQDFVAAEDRLAQAQTAYTVAKETEQQASAATDNNSLKSAAQDNLDAATNELKSAQTAYNSILTTSAAQSVLEARGRVAAAQGRVDNAETVLAQLQTGSQSLQLQSVSDKVKQAQTAVTQATDAVAEAKAAVDLIDLQIEKSTVKAPVAGIITSRNLEVGELAASGGVLMVISQLNQVYLTVYISEDQYGQIKLGQSVSISVDSFPNTTFSGTVQYISNKAEYTPDNVQTVNGRKATVYAVKITVPNANLDLKPGMPADATFK